VIFAKDPKISSLLQKLFKTEKIKKTYWAFVEGEYNQSHVLNMPLKDPKSGQLQKAKTILDVYQKTETITWLICEPKTGRTHQIRKHLKLAGFPILGDELYGGAEFEQMALCAVQIEFTHPVYRKTVQVRTFPDLILKNALKKQGIRF
jgi:23S rRNA-/tRNA-specific pseudouridylate synthase